MISLHETAQFYKLICLLCGYIKNIYHVYDFFLFFLLMHLWWLFTTLFINICHPVPITFKMSKPGQLNWQLIGLVPRRSRVQIPARARSKRCSPQESQNVKKILLGKIKQHLTQNKILSKFATTQSWTIPSKINYELKKGDKKTSINQRRHRENLR